MGYANFGSPKKKKNGILPKGEKEVKDIQSPIVSKERYNPSLELPFLFYNRAKNQNGSFFLWI